MNRSPGGAERQLVNLLNHLPHQQIHLLILNDNTFLESLIYNDRVFITYSHSRSLISVFLSFVSSREVPCSRLTIVGWMAKANHLCYLLPTFYCLLSLLLWFGIIVQVFFFINQFTVKFYSSLVYFFHCFPLRRLPMSLILTLYSRHCL